MAHASEVRGDYRQIDVAPFVGLSRACEPKRITFWIRTLSRGYSTVRRIISSVRAAVLTISSHPVLGVVARLIVTLSGRPRYDLFVGVRPGDVSSKEEYLLSHPVLFARNRGIRLPAAQLLIRLDGDGEHFAGDSGKE